MRLRRGLDCLRKVLVTDWVCVIEVGEAHAGGPRVDVKAEMTLR